MENNQLTTKKKTSVMYVVNACLPNKRAHGIQIINTCNALCEAGADLRLVTPAFYGSDGTMVDYYGVEQKFKHTKLFSFDIPKFTHRFRLRSAFFFVFINFYLLLTFFKCKLRREKFVVYARGEVATVLMPISYLLPVIFETHQIRNHQWLYRRVLQRVARVVVITDALKQKFVTNYGLKEAKILVARDSVDIDRFSLAEKKDSLWSDLGIPDGKKIILYSGSLGKEKGVYTLADTASLLPSDCHIVFLGGLEHQIEVFTQQYGQVKNITIAGQVGHTLVPSYIKSADVLVLPDLATDTYARLYTSPMKLFEYMASGIPIIASDVPSLREVLTDDSAVFFDSCYAKSLASSIDTALRSPTISKQLGVKAQEIVLEFTWKKRGERILDHIENCL